MIDIAKARALCAAATPGPWTFTTCYGVATVQHGPDRDAIAHAVDYLQVGDEYDNASFIASARTLLPEALDALEQERAVCVTITTALKQAIVERDPLKAEVERLTQSDRNVILNAAYSKMAKMFDVKEVRQKIDHSLFDDTFEVMEVLITACDLIEALERENAALLAEIEKLKASMRPG